MALPGPSLATHAFTLPFTDPKRIAATLPFEVEGELPFELSQVVFDHQVTRRRANATDLIVGLVRREELSELLKLLAARGLDPRVVTHPAIAYQNLFLGAPERFEVAPGATVAVLDLGHRRTSVAVGRPAEGVLFARTFPGGGHDLSGALAAEFQVPFVEAEAWKERDGSLVPGGTAEHERARVALLHALAPIVRQTRATLKAASGRDHLPVARLLLAGGHGAAPGPGRAPRGRAGAPDGRPPAPGGRGLGHSAGDPAPRRRGVRPGAPRDDVRRAKRPVQPPPGRVRLPGAHGLPARSPRPGGGLRRGARAPPLCLQREPGHPPRPSRDGGGRTVVRGDPARSRRLREELRPGPEPAPGTAESRGGGTQRLRHPAPRRGGTAGARRS